MGAVAVSGHDSDAARAKACVEYLAGIPTEEIVGKPLAMDPRWVVREEYDSAVAPLRDVVRQFLALSPSFSRASIKMLEEIVAEGGDSAKLAGVVLAARKALGEPGLDSRPATL